MEGRVKFFNEEKGYGFIETGNSKDLFFHVTEVRDRAVLREGDVVEYDLGQGRRGPCALNIQLIRR